MQDGPGQQAEEYDARPGAQAALDAGKGRRCGAGIPGCPGPRAHQMRVEGQPATENWSGDRTGHDMSPGHGRIYQAAVTVGTQTRKALLPEAR